jgi:hypothetical protein
MTGSCSNYPATHAPSNTRRTLCENCQKPARRGLPHAFGDTKPGSHDLLGRAAPLLGASTDSHIVTHRCRLLGAAHPIIRPNSLGRTRQMHRTTILPRQSDGAAVPFVGRIVGRTPVGGNAVLELSSVGCASKYPLGVGR